MNDPSLSTANSASRQRATSQLIYPGRVWTDDRGMPIQAHGGAVIKHQNEWFWFGEDRSPSNQPHLRYVACYSSTDLVNWRFRNQVLKLSDPADLGPNWVLERPKVFYHAASGGFVMYMHIDGRLSGSESNYSAASLGIAVCDTIDGHYKFVRRFRPFGLESRDIGQFIDDDGEAYLIFESRPSKGFYIASLSADYLDVENIICFIEAPIEGGAIVRYENLYYLIGSKLTGWWPNANKYATAANLRGPWSPFRDIAPAETCTYGSQSTNLLKIVGSERTSVIYLGDIWRPYELSDSRYLWYPLEIDNGSMKLNPSNHLPGPWAIDTETGRISYP